MDGEAPAYHTHTQNDFAPPSYAHSRDDERVLERGPSMAQGTPLDSVHAIAQLSPDTEPLKSQTVSSSPLTTTQPPPTSEPLAHLQTGHPLLLDGSVLIYALGFTCSKCKLPSIVVLSQRLLTNRTPLMQAIILGSRIRTLPIHAALQVVVSSLPSLSLTTFYAVSAGPNMPAHTPVNWFPHPPGHIPHQTTNGLCEPTPHRPPYPPHHHQPPAAGLPQVFVSSTPKNHPQAPSSSLPEILV